MHNNTVTVLIAEDESMVLLGFKSFLSQLGYSVIGEAYDGEMAVELANKLNPDLLIMDVKMPKLDGIQALSAINKDRSIMIPCVFITAYSDDQLIERAKSCGAFSYLIKPITINSLKAALEIALQRFDDYKLMQNKLTDAQQALNDRKTVEKAKGYLMDNFGFKEKQAMEYLQKKSRDTNKKLVVVAKSILKMDEALHEG